MKPSNLISKAVRILKSGGLVCFPTETVYGVGARLFDPKGIQKIYAVKRRPADNPLIVHIGNKKELYSLTQNLCPEANLLIKAFWPGPLTLVCHRSQKIPLGVTAGLETVAIRMPYHALALKLLRALKEPIAAPSANRSGRPSPTRYEDVLQELGNEVELVLPSVRTSIGLESTVLDVTSKPFRILRPGFITFEEIKKIVPEIVIESGKKRDRQTRSPGVKHKHYQPQCLVKLVKSAQWGAVIEESLKKGEKIGVLACKLKVPRDKGIIFSRTFDGDQRAYAKHLYSTFFDAENAGVDILLVESIQARGLGRAIMDRLTRASCE